MGVGADPVLMDEERGGRFSGVLFHPHSRGPLFIVPEIPVVPVVPDGEGGAGVMVNTD